MEVKLRDYKYRIQVLRKEKQDLENTYEHKFNHMQPEDKTLRISQRTEESKGEEKEKEEAFDQEKDLMKNQLFSLKEQNVVILA